MNRRCSIMGDIKTFLCTLCGKSYKENRTLRHHVLKSHPDTDLEVVAPTANSKKSYKFKCENCKRQFNYLHNLKTHQRMSHGKEVIRKSVVCPICKFQTNVKRNLNKHFTSQHGIMINIEEREFPSFQDFSDWMNSMEKDTSSKFLLRSSPYLGVGEIKSYLFQCHRSGNFISKSTGQRQLKRVGSSKINGMCPADIRVKQYKNGVCKIKYVSTHVGHDHKDDVHHLTLTKREKNALAVDIAKGVGYQTIKQKVKNTSTDSKVQRINLLSYQDLDNVERNMVRGKLSSSKAKDIQQKHKSGLLLNREHVIQEEEKSWKISSSDCTEVYTVRENDIQCCKIVCVQCKACIHRYTCTCIDNSYRFNMCEHIHCVCQVKLSVDAESTVHSEQSESDADNNENDLFVISDDDDVCTEKETILTEESKKSCASLLDEQNKIIEQFISLTRSLTTQAELECVKKSVSALEATLKAMKSASKEPMIKILDPRTLNEKNLVPHKKCDSLKNKRTRSTSAIKKPANMQMQ